MFNLWDDAIELVGGKENMDTFCEAVKYADKDVNGEYLKNLEKLLSLAEKAKDYITVKIFITKEDVKKNGIFHVLSMKLKNDKGRMQFKDRIY